MSKNARFAGSASQMRNFQYNFLYLLKSHIFNMLSVAIVYKSAKGNLKFGMQSLSPIFDPVTGWGFGTLLSQALICFHKSEPDKLK